MNKSQKIHCPSCGVAIEFPYENEGTTGNCPSCKSPVWLSHLAEKDDASKASGRIQVPTQKLGDDSSGSNSTVIGLLVLLILFNLALGYQVIQLKSQLSKGQHSSSRSDLSNAGARQAEVTNAIRRARTGVEMFSREDAIIELLETMELLDEDIRAEMAGLRSGFTTHSESINELMEASSQLDASIESIYEDLSNVSTSLEALSNSLSDVQENQLLLQNMLNQSPQ